MSVAPLRAVSIHPFDQLSRIQVLFNTLIGEHHVRRALLDELCDLMGDAGPELFEVRRMTCDLLAEIERGDGGEEFDVRVRKLARIVEHTRAEGAANI
jgi:hypothetical protein